VVVWNTGKSDQAEGGRRQAEDNDSDVCVPLTFPKGKYKALVSARVLLCGKYS
jgi:hypothetical protein